MRQGDAADRVRHQLESLIAQLGELRNASTRDPNFKQWRQSALTAIQLGWPGDQSRSERFRRVPFSSPSNKMSNKLTREFYERGCAEAAIYLRSLIGEIDVDGLPAGASVAPPGGTAALPEDDYPVIELPGEGEETFAPRARIAASPPMEDAPAAPPLTPPLQGSELELPPSAPRARVERRKGSRLGAAHRKSGKRALREMLGFNDVTGPPPPEAHEEDVMEPAPEREVGGPPRLPFGKEAQRLVPQEPVASEPPRMPVASAPPVEPAPPLAPPPSAPPPDLGVTSAPPREIELPTMGTVQVGPPVRPAAPPPPAAPMPPVSAPPPVVIQPPPVTARPPAQTPEEAAAEFLRTSPVLRSEARPVPRPEGRARTPQSPTAAALIAIVGEITRFEIPEGQRAGMRAALLDLAHQIDDQTLSWPVLSDSIHLVLGHPMLARQVLPLLIPFLDRAA